MDEEAVRDSKVDAVMSVYDAVFLDGTRLMLDSEDQSKLYRSQAASTLNPRELLKVVKMEPAITEVFRNKARVAGFPTVMQMDLLRVAK